MDGRSWRFETIVRGLTASPLGKDAIDSVFGDIAHLPDLIGDERTEAEDLAIATLRAGDPRAAHALGAAGCTRAVPALLDFATSEAPPHTRLFAVSGLLELSPADGRAIAIEILRDRTIWRGDRCEAIRLLVAHRDGETEAVLEEAAADPDPEVRSWATWALEDIRGQ
jgi:hypothetical protein